MTDFIKTSQVIQRFLDKEKIKVEPDEFAPVVVQLSGHEPWVVSYDDVDSEGIYPEEILCPFYGPGGADNSLKALRAFWGRGGELIIKGPPHTAMMDFGEGGRLCFGGKRSETTDGKVLHDLLYAIATESTGEKENEDE